MNRIVNYYSKPSVYTSPYSFQALLQSLPNKNDKIIEFIKKILVHPIDARKSRFRFNYKKTTHDHIHHRTVNDILSNPKVNALLELNTCDLDTDVSQRGILSCDHHALLFASILRLKGNPVRLRCGYATYILPGALIPHWVCQVYNDSTNKWDFIDPERVKFSFNQDDFLTAGQIWIDIKQGKLKVNKLVPDYRRGIDGAKYRLLNDINALMKNELLNYDWIVREAAPQAPRIFSWTYAKLDQSKKDLLDNLAYLSINADNNFQQLKAIYSEYVPPESLRI